MMPGDNSKKVEEPSAGSTEKRFNFNSPLVGNTISARDHAIAIGSLMIGSVTEGVGVNFGRLNMYGDQGRRVSESRASSERSTETMPAFNSTTAEEIPVSRATLESSARREDISLRQRSEVDSTRFIDNKDWLLSLIRKPDNTHAEHAFMVLEGLIGERKKIWFMDLVGNPILPGIGDGKIRIYEYEGDHDSSLLFSCDRRMMDIHRGERILHKSWPIAKEDAESLVARIRATRETPPKFNLLGKTSVFAIGTGVTSSVETGHNCFTWSKEQIRSINDEHITLPESDLASWAYSATSSMLKDPLRRDQYSTSAVVATSILFGAAAVGLGVAFAKNNMSISSCTIQ